MDITEAEAHTHPLLTAAEETTLALTIEAGVLAADALARGMRPHGATTEELRWLAAAGAAAPRRYVEANLRLVAMVARRTAAQVGLAEADLFQEGCLGLLIAVDRFDCRRGCRFATYALPWIRALVRAASAQMLGTLNLPTSRASQLRHARGIETALAQDLGRQPTAAEIAGALGRSTEWTRRLLAHELPQPLDQVGDLGAADADLERVLTEGGPVADLLRVLKGFDRQVLEMRLGFAGEPRGYTEIARLLGVTATRVRRAEARALDRIREVCPQAARDRLAG